MDAIINHRDASADRDGYKVALCDAVLFALFCHDQSGVKFFLVRFLSFCAVNIILTAFL